MSKEFVKHSPWNKAVLAVYHCDPRQQFSDLRGEKHLEKGWAMKSGARAPTLCLDEQLAIGYLKSRLAAGIFSWPSDLAEVATSDAFEELALIAPLRKLPLK